jgi:hypothetical protein
MTENNRQVGARRFRVRRNVTGTEARACREVDRDTGLRPETVR